MSPASQAGLEVKRYIGSCLISASALRKTAGGGCGAGDAGGAALVPLCGLPLISMAARPGSFSRLAMHTQGAPLILAGRYGARKHGQRQQQQQQRAQRAAEGPPPAAPRTRHAPASSAARAAEGAATEAATPRGSSGRTTSSDSLNTASDESSGPSENSLPRIIKPRKRRKKDRKPLAAPAHAPAAQQQQQQPAAPPSPEAAAPEGSSIVTLRPYVPLCFELYDGARPLAGGTRRPAEPDKSRPQAHAPRKKPLPAESEPPDKTAPQQQPASPSPSVCQCRYCDPRGHIWDVRRHCYSPVLTAPATDSASAAAAFHKSPFASIPLFLSAPAAGDAADTEDGFFSDDLPTSSSPFSLSGDGEDPPGDGANALRRSWSGCSTSSSSSSSSSSSLASDSGGRARTAPVAVASQGLQVSTEIVTSPNGHRDLEIRFYSCTPPEQEAASAARAAARAPTEAAWPASRADTEGDSDEDGECAEKFLGESLWANILADELGARALGDEVLQLSIRAEE